MTQTQQDEVTIHSIDSLAGYHNSLNKLLIDSVNNGASIGFIAPLTSQVAEQYWQSIEVELRNNERKLLIATIGSKVIGAVQLSLCQKANGTHRGEVEKLMVHTSARGKGLSKKLMLLLEQSALECSLQLLVLDTRLGDVASCLYQKLGFTKAGEIPYFAQNSSGELQSTVLFYKLIA